MKSQLLMLAVFLGVVLGLLGASTVVVVREGREKVEGLMTDASAEPSVAEIEAADGDGPAGVIEPDSAPAPRNSPPVEVAEVTPEFDPESAEANPTRMQGGVQEARDAIPAGETDSVAPSRLRTEQLAKMFAGMQAREAARVLSQMEDADIEIVLSLLKDRQASAILGNLPPERAAMITQNVIRRERSLK